ncbi:MAG: acetyltransferase [Snowella sp.]|nr:acetyltransferase [Snowella sp.]
MLLKNKQDGALIKIEDTIQLINPLQSNIEGCIQEGQEEQPPEEFAKEMLIFPSGEELPRCWLDANYQHYLNH